VLWLMYSRAAPHIHGVGKIHVRFRAFRVRAGPEVPRARRHRGAHFALDDSASFPEDSGSLHCCSLRDKSLGQWAAHPGAGSPAI